MVCKYFELFIWLFKDKANASVGIPHSHKLWVGVRLTRQLVTYTIGVKMIPAYNYITHDVLF